MKGILILSLLGLSLHSALAVSPFEVIVEEWEVSIFIMSIKHDDLSIFIGLEAQVQ